MNSGALFQRNMGIFEIILLSVGLAMDAFAVSVCKGLAAKKAGWKERLLCGGWFGFFQGAMPFAGYMVGTGFRSIFNVIAPWLTFILLSVIGGNMVREAFSSEEEETKSGFDIKTMLGLAVATSIDALAVGFTFVGMPARLINAGDITNTLLACCIIGVITFLLSTVGVQAGHSFGIRYKSGAEVMGGTILIFIGLNAIRGFLDSSGATEDQDTIFGLLIPFLGTIMGASAVYAGKRRLSDKIRVILAGTSAGIMFSVAVWALLGLSAKGFAVGGNSVLPVFLSFCTGAVVQYLLDHSIPHTHAFTELTEGPESRLGTNVKVMLSEVIHHVPEGMAIGAVYAGLFLRTDWISVPTAMIMAVAMAVQNFPEALFVSMPLRDKGTGKGTAFLMGVVSGAPVPLMGVVTVIATVLFPFLLPYIMAMAGGAMIFTIIEEMPMMAEEGDNDKGTLAFVISFAVMMLLINM